MNTNAKMVRTQFIFCDVCNAQPYISSKGLFIKHWKRRVDKGTWSNDFDPPPSNLLYLLLFIL